MDLLFNRLSQAVIFMFMITLLILAMSTYLGPRGESDDYTISTIAFERHPFSQRILPEDREQVKVDYPEQYDFVKLELNFIDKDGNMYPWYFPTYSISILPVKWFLQLIGASPSRAYVVSNVIFYTIALSVVYFFLKASRKTVFLTILLLSCSSAVVYYCWTSAELFICSLMIITLVFWLNGNRYLAGLFCAIASTLNITINAICIAIIIDFFITEYTKENKSLKEQILLNWKKTILLGVCFLPALFMPIFNLIIAGTINLQNGLLAPNAHVGWFGRFLSYLFDLNLGFLPYFPILLIMFFIAFILGIIKKDKSIIMIGLGFWGVLYLYSFMPHINCGMTTISRYNAWISPFLIFIATVKLPRLLKGIRVNYIVSCLCVLSALISVCVTSSAMRYNNGRYLEFTPIAKAVLEHAPALYNPYPSTFISRTEHVDGGYDSNHKPTIYTDENNIVKKILIPQGTADMVIDLVCGDAALMENLVNKIEKVKEKNKDFAYVNVSGNIILTSGYSFNPLERDDLQQMCRGIYGWEQTFHWFSSDATIWIKSDNLTQGELLFKFTVAPYIHTFIENDTLKIDIFINDILIKSIPLDEERLLTINEIYIDAAELPYNESGVFEINIMTNGSYNPSKAIPEEGYNPNDMRDISIGVLYIGPAY